MLFNAVAYLLFVNMFWLRIFKIDVNFTQFAEPMLTVGRDTVCHCLGLFSSIDVSVICKVYLICFLLSKY